MSALAALTLASAVTLAAWALYVTVVEHPARLDAGAGPGRAQFRSSYRRAAPWQASFALVACLDGGPLGDGDARRLLERWGRLHAVRTLLGAAGVGAFLLGLARA